MDSPNTIPLSQAALRLRQSWAATWAMVLRGDLPGEQRSNGRWFVSAEALDAIEHKRAA